MELKGLEVDYIKQQITFHEYKMMKEYFNKKLNEL